MGAPNYARPAFTGSNWKPLPRKVQKRSKRRVEKRDDEAARKKVREYWGFKCCVCKRKTSTVHEEKRRGAGGEVSLRNSYLACDEIDGGVCHPLLQSRDIYAVCPGEIFDARKIERFEMTKAIAALVFERRARPASVRIV